ncbi:MAG: DUF6779 domain-containing protein [Pseudonocardiaceae bacterium]
MTSPKPELRHESGRFLILGSVVLAVLAAAALALGSDDSRLLRLGIVAALWATLFGTFAAVRLRREVGSGVERADELRTVYQLELDREIAARREHELKVERELREQVERRERQEIVALRGELAALRDTLRNLLGGDVMVERVALRAESTRLLPMPEHSWTSADGHGRISAAKTVPRVAPSLPAAESTVRGVGPTGRDSWEVRKPDRPDIYAPDIYAQTAAELATDAANRTWSPAVSPTPSWRSALDQDPLSGPVNRQTSGPENRQTSPENRQMSPENRQMSQGGRHSRSSAPRYGSTPPSAHEANSNGSNERRPVHELLASYGDSSLPRRRHGRVDD